MFNFLKPLSLILLFLSPSLLLASSATPDVSGTVNAPLTQLEAPMSSEVPTANTLKTDALTTKEFNGSDSADLNSSDLMMAENLVVGSIREITGRAMIHKQGEVRGNNASSGDTLKAQDILRTKRNSQAIVELIDGSTIILEEQSSLHLKGIRSLSLEEGTVVFDIRKRGASKGLRVATKTAVIGVKGTQFLVKDEDNNVAVYLNEGTVEVEPIEGSFKHYKKVTTKSFDDYNKQMMAEFEQEKAKIQEGVEQMKREFVDYLKSYEMEAGTAVSISGNELTSYPMPSDYQELFKQLELEADITRQQLDKNE